MTAHDDGEIDDVDEFLNTLGQVEYDEQLVGLIGDGYNVNSPGDQPVADLLSAWRDDIASEPTNVSKLPSGRTDKYGNPPTNTGGKVSISDDAAALRTITLPFGAIQQAQGELDAALELAAQLLGTASGLDEIQGAVQQAKTELDGGYSMVQQVENVLEQVAARHQGG